MLSSLYLPPYSPDFNPIENAFAKLKALLKKAAARTLDELWDAIARALCHFTSRECGNYFAAAGYELEWLSDREAVRFGHTGNRLAFMSQTPTARASDPKRQVTFDISPAGPMSLASKT